MAKMRFSMMSQSFSTTLTPLRTLEPLCKLIIFASRINLNNILNVSYNSMIKGYEPKGRDWIKSQIFNALKT
jgi:hypothetical protein